MVRDTIKRQSDVDAASLKYEVEPGTGRYRNGTITFVAQKGKSNNLQKLSEAKFLSGATQSWPAQRP